LSNLRNQEIRIVIFRALAENSSFIFLALEDVVEKKINVLFERWLF